MVSFETVTAEKHNFGRNNFIEVARKKAITDTGGENVFISISKGYYLPDDSERFLKSFTVPDNDEVKEFISKKLMEI